MISGVNLHAFVRASVGKFQRLGFTPTAGQGVRHDIHPVRIGIDVPAAAFTRAVSVYDVLVPTIGGRGPQIVAGERSLAGASSCRDEI